MTLQALGPGARDAFVISECVGKRRASEIFLQPEYLININSLELIESILTNYHELFPKVRLSFPPPIRDLYAISCPQIALMFTAFRLP